MKLSARIQFGMVCSIVIAVFSAFALSCGKQPDGDSPGSTAAALQNPTGPAPITEGAIVWTGFTATGLFPDENHCRGTLIAADWLLTAAHCFADFLLKPVGSHPPPSGSATFFAPSGNVSVSFAIADVFFPSNPYALPTALIDFGPDFPPTTETYPRTIDLALVHISPAITSITPAKIWHPAGQTHDQLADLRGASVTVTGAGTVELSSGKSVVKGYNGQERGGLLLATSREQPTVSPLLQKSDSGGGLYLDVPPLPIVPFAVPCAIQPGGPGSTSLLIATNNGFNAPEAHPEQATENWFTPIYEPDVATWIAMKTAQDQDGDGICNDKPDNCIAVKNPDQANCNVEAEDAFGHGIHLGDACDPTPCPQVSTAHRTTIQVSSEGPGPFGSVPTILLGGGLPSIVISDFFSTTARKSRSIDDFVRILSILGPNLGSVTSAVTPRFCHCRDSQGRPISNPATCRDQFFCFQDGRQAGPSFVELAFNPNEPPDLELNQTVWHKMTLAGQPRGAAVPIQYPGTAIQTIWAFAVDNDFWVNQQQFFPPVPVDTNYPAGTDLGGAFWAHDPTTAGAAKHGFGSICITGNCSVADHYAWGIAPDRKTQVITGHHFIPGRALVVWGRGCRVCGDRFVFPDDVPFNAAPIVTFTTRTLDAVLWASDGTGIAIDEMVSPNLRLGLLDTGLNWISSSEPAGVCNADGCTKAFALTADGTQIADTIAVTGDGFKGAVLDGLVEFDESGTFINNSGGTIPDSVAGMLAIPGPTPRTGYAAAWSQTVGKLYVLGGTNPSTGAVRADAWTKRQQVESGWSSVALDPLHAPRNVRAATFSPADGRMWVLDRPTTQTRLLRIDPEAGTVDIDVPVPALDSYRDVWLSTIGDGRVLLTATTSSSHVIALLSSTPSSPRSPLLVLGAHFADGELVGPPSVGYNLITVPLGHTEDGLGIGSVMPAAVASTELTSTWPALSGQIAPDQNGNGVPDSLESC